MKIVSVHEAKTHLSRLLEAVTAGETVLVAKHGRPVARLVPIHADVRTPGKLKGNLHIGEDFDEPLPEEILAALEGRGEDDLLEPGPGR